jgi:hypothetical protein
MNKHQKLKNMLNANLISERRYIQMKDNGVSEDWKTNVAAGLASMGAMASTTDKDKSIDPVNKADKTISHVDRKVDSSSVADPFSTNKAIKKNSNALISVNLTQSFKSGGFNINSPEMVDGINKLKEYIKANPAKNFVLVTTASESNVPNQSGYGVNDLANKRASVVQKAISGSVGNSSNLDFKTNAIVGGPEWDGGNKDEQKYTEHQFVTIDVYDAGVSTCSLEQISKKGVIGDVSNGYETNNIAITQHGSFKMIPGPIPDRLMMVKDGKTVYDTKFYASENPYSAQWNHVPLHIANLSQLYTQHKDLPCFSNLGEDLKTFNSLEELISTIQQDKGFDYRKDTRREVKEGLIKLKQLWDSGQREYVFYTIKEATSVSVKGELESPTNVKTFSMLGNTGIELIGNNCK